MRIFLVRHAHAGARGDWDDADHLRPLSEKGWDRANSLASQLADEGIERVLSSPYVRCTQSVGPLAAKLGLDVDEHAALAEGASLASGIELVDSLIEQGSTAALCSHGDVIPELLAGLGRRGAEIDPNGACPKGSVWILEVDGAAVTRAVYAGR
jgi:phosphohistidine phosphatase SixA